MNGLYRRIQTGKRVEYKLSILILSLRSRLDTLAPLIQTLSNQTVQKPVQLLYLGDNKSMSVGEKRNDLLSIAKGKYVCFIDDDDTITPDYVDEILKAIEQTPEVITFNVKKFDKGVFLNERRFYLNNGPDRIAPDRSHYKMLPNHLCVWRKDIIQKLFMDKNLGEDYIWAADMVPYYSSTHNIDKILYYYMSDKDKSETR
jgi:glycosyltransferase involved in cell wall biosynthesis